MAADLKDKLGVDSELVGASGGIFDVTADGKMIYSKHAEGNEFPAHTDVIQRLENYQSDSS